MLIDVTLPQLGESVTEGTISKWLVREGDVVKKDQPLVVDRDRQGRQRAARARGGRVAKLLATEGQVVPVKTVIAQIDEGASPRSSAAPGAPASLPPARSPPPRCRSDARRAAPLATPTVRKTALEHDVDLAGGAGHRRTRSRRPRTTCCAPPARGTNDHAGPAQPADRGPAAGRPQPPPRRSSSRRSSTRAAASSRRSRASASARSRCPRTGPHEGDKVVPFTRRRRITADHMTYSKFASPHVVTVAEVDLHRASKLRDAHKERYKAEGMSLTMLAFVVVATAHALRENLALNARVLDDSYVVLRDINIGVAVDSPDGLVVPVVRRADELGVRGIVRVDRRSRASAPRAARSPSTTSAGATFSVSNPGLKGNLFGGAIINQPNVGILRMGEIQKRVVVVESPDGEDHIAIHPVMYMALSYDHRVVDGVAANAFLWRVTEILEKAEFEV